MGWYIVDDVVVVVVTIGCRSDVVVADETRLRLNPLSGVHDLVGCHDGKLGTVRLAANVQVTGVREKYQLLIDQANVMVYVFLSINTISNNQHIKL